MEAAAMWPRQRATAVGPSISWTSQIQPWGDRIVEAPSPVRQHSTCWDPDRDRPDTVQPRRPTISLRETTLSRHSDPAREYRRLFRSTFAQDPGCLDSPWQRVTPSVVLPTAHSHPRHQPEAPEPSHDPVPPT